MAHRHLVTTISHSDTSNATVRQGLFVIYDGFMSYSCKTWRVFVIALDYISHVHYFSSFREFFLVWWLPIDKWQPWYVSDATLCILVTHTFSWTWSRETVLSELQRRRHGHQSVCQILMTSNLFTSVAWGKLTSQSFSGVSFMPTSHFRGRKVLLVSSWSLSKKITSTHWMRFFWRVSCFSMSFN